MIIHIRGTAGSGKTTLARRLMGEASLTATYMQKGRKQPIGYAYTLPSGETLGVIGHYNSACGGADTLTAALGMDGIYDLVRKAAASHTHVLYEGLILCSDWRRVALLAQDHDVRVFNLTTPIEECLEGIQARRAARHGQAPEMKDSTIRNVTGKVKTNDGCIKNMKAHGVRVVETDRETAFHMIKELLDV